MQLFSFVIFTFLALKFTNSELVLGNKTVRTNKAIAPKIVGGYEISIEEAPYQVVLLYNDDLFCGGSILSCRFVLTAAHCKASNTKIIKFFRN